MTLISRFSIAFIAAVFLAVSTATHADPASDKPVGDPYPLNTDAATGEPLGDNPVVIQHENRELRFANEANAATFQKDAVRYLTKIDEQIVQQQRPYYPLDKCIISGEALDSMGVPEDVVFRNRLVRLCCAGCKDGLADDAAGIFGKLDAAAIEKQKANYQLKTCPVSDLGLGEMGEALDVVVAGRLVRLCCPGCQDQLRANPAAVLSKIDAARADENNPALSAPAPAKEHSHPHGHGM